MIAKLRAILLRDWLTALRYRTGVSMQLLGVIAEIAAFYYLAVAIGPGFRPDGISYFPFLLIGTAIYGFVTAGAFGFVQSIQTAQTTGTLEVLLTTSTPPAALITLSAISAFGSKLFSFVCYLGLGFLLISGGLHRANWLVAIFTFVVTVLLAVGIGMIGASLQIAIQKGLGVIQMIAAFGWFLSGTMFPISVLPTPVRYVAAANPLVYSLDALRRALISGASFRDLSTPLVILATFSVALFLVGTLSLRVTLNRARRNGTLSFF